MLDTLSTAFAWVLGGLFAFIAAPFLLGLAVFLLGAILFGVLLLVVWFEDNFKKSRKQCPKPKP